MAIANSYFNSSPITDSDIFVGTKYTTNRTVNYTALNIADYLNINSRISISGQLTFKFTILPNVAKTIAFENGGGDGRLFSSIDKLIVSILDAGGSNITVFLDYLIDSEILLAEQNQPNSFGHYKVTNYVVTTNPNFYELSLQYIGGNGNIYKDVYYDMTPWASSGGIGTTPNLQQVTDVVPNGNVTTNDIKINQLGLWDAPSDDYGYISLNDSRYTFKNYAGIELAFFERNAGLAIPDGNAFYGVISQPSGFTTNRTYNLPDANGTIALTSDIITPTLQQVTDEGATTDNPIYVSDGAGNEISIQIGQVQILDEFGSYSQMGATGVGFVNGDGTGIEQCSVSIGASFGTQQTGLFLTAQENGNLATLELKLAPEYYSGLPIEGIVSNYFIPFKPSGDYTLATTGDIPTKTSDLINDGDNGTSHFISLEDLPSTLTLYPTTAASGIGGYNKLVSSITDPSYNTTAVDVSTGAITGTDQLIAGLITEPNQIVGNPGIFNMTTIGNIRKTSGSGQAEFYFRVYKRDAGGTETLILQSNNTQQITSAIYAEFNASGLWNDGVFTSTDRIVIKFYGTKVGGGSNPTYDFQFGGTSPVRSIVPVPLNVVPVLSLDELSNVNITGVTNNQLLAYESATSLWKNRTVVEDTIVNGVIDKAPSQNAVFDALNLRKRIIISDTASATVTGTTALTLVKTYELTAGTLPASGFLDLFMFSTRTITAAIHTMGLYINTTNNFATATLVSSITTNGNFSPILPYKATFVLKSNLMIGGLAAPTQGTNYGNSTTQTSVACNNSTNSVWFFVGITPGNSGQIINFQSMEMVV
jgi:hypothetical protein